VKAHNGLRAIDYDSLVFTWKNGQSLNLQGPFKSLFDNTEAYTKAFQVLFQTINPSRSSFNFSSATKSLSQAIAKGSLAREDLQTSLAKAKADLKIINTRKSELDNILNKATADHVSISKISAEVSELLANISAKNDETNALSTRAEELRSRINAYEGDFQGFQDQLDDMRSNYATNDEKLISLISRFNDHAKSFDEMIQRSDQMLSASTVAGLASEFGTIRTDLSDKLDAAHKSFNRAIGFLFASALPLILFVFAPFIVAIFPDNPNLVKAITGSAGSQTGWHYFGQVIARFVILLPAIWYVTFCTARYNALFRLKEHYAYKYSMAVAVDGFKKQAPQHEGMIAALVFEQLAFNPADKLGKKFDSPESPPNPIARLLLDRLRKEKDDE